MAMPLSADIQPEDASLPSVSVIMPVYNEEAVIERSLRAVLEQDYPSSKLEVVVADGMSTDQTRQIVESFQREHPNVRLIENPRRIVPCGLNRAIACARGEVIVRLDGHRQSPGDSAARGGGARRPLAAVRAGGMLGPMGSILPQRSIHKAYFSPVGLGGAALKASATSDGIREVDAVHGGCWRRERLQEAGGFDEAMVRNQDDELSFRLRKKGGRIYQHQGIRVIYHVRNSFRKLFQQFAQYGFWKVEVIRRHPRQASPRHLAPALLVLALFSVFVAAPVSPAGAKALFFIVGSYAGTLGAVSLWQLRHGGLRLWPGVVLALAAMHLGYGVGFIVGTLRACFGTLPGDRLFEQVTR